MARGGQGKATTRAATPPPLPPERRTVGQLVAETIRLYGANFVRALPLGLVVAVSNQLALEFSSEERGVVSRLDFDDYTRAAAVLVLAAPVFALGFAYASALATGSRLSARSLAVAAVVGTLTFVPAALLFPFFLVAGVLWLALTGLAVPAAVAERRAVGGALRHGLRLGRTDYVHAAGSLAALIVLFALARNVLALLLESQAENTVRTAIFLADTALAPLLFLGGALLYVDQEARLRSRAEGTERKE